jgi:hypothetical protein
MMGIYNWRYGMGYGDIMGDIMGFNGMTINI